MKAGREVNEPVFRAPGHLQAQQNKKLIRGKADKILDDAVQQKQATLEQKFGSTKEIKRKQDPKSGRDIMALAFKMSEPAIEHLFDDFTLFVHDQMMKEPTIKMEPLPKMQEKKETNKEKNENEVNESEEIKKEFRGMKDCHVWRKIKKKDMPEGRRCVKYQWVFQIKNGNFRPRFVVCEIQSVDFTESCVPIINDVTR